MNPDTTVKIIMIYIILGIMFETLYWFGTEPSGCKHYLVAVFIVLCWPLFIVLVATGYWK